jgi:hypothetical protein
MPGCSRDTKFKSMVLREIRAADDTIRTAKINMPFAESGTAAGAGLAGGLPKCGPIPAVAWRLRVSRC